MSRDLSALGRSEFVDALIAKSHGCATLESLAACHEAARRLRADGARIAELEFELVGGHDRLFQSHLDGLGRDKRLVELERLARHAQRAGGGWAKKLVGRDLENEELRRAIVGEDPLRKRIAELERRVDAAYSHLGNAGHIDEVADTKREFLGEQDSGDDGPIRLRTDVDDDVIDAMGDPAAEGKERRYGYSCTLDELAGDLASGSPVHEVVTHLQSVLAGVGRVVAEMEAYHGHNQALSKAASCDEAFPARPEWIPGYANEATWVAKLREVLK